MDKTGKCYVAKDIRQKIDTGDITAVEAPHQVQVSSFEPRIGDCVYVIDDGYEGLFRPNATSRIEDALSRMPVRRRRQFSITKGFEIKRGSSYLFPLTEQIRVRKEEFVFSSPKSSFGRLFVNTRLLTDYNPCVDEMAWQYKNDRHLSMWLLVQPLTFNLIVYPGLSLNQLRFFSGKDARFTDSMLEEEMERAPFVTCETSSTHAYIPVIRDGLQLHLDVIGATSDGVVGLRARHTPIPVDLSKPYAHDVLDYFDIVRQRDGKITVHTGEHYLLASKETLHIPPHLSAELKSHSHILLNGPLHFAGFIDNGFEGNLVFEIRSDEITNTELCDGMPISKIDVFRASQVPDVVYDTTKNHYKGQRGITPSKFFKPLNL